MRNFSHKPSSVVCIWINWRFHSANRTYSYSWRAPIEQPIPIEQLTSIKRPPPISPRVDDVVIMRKLRVFFGSPRYVIFISPQLIVGVFVTLLQMLSLVFTREGKNSERSEPNAVWWEGRCPCENALALPTFGFPLYHRREPWNVEWEIESNFTL